MSDARKQEIDQVPDDGKRTWTISRRGFLIGMAATGAALPLATP